MTIAEALAWASTRLHDASSSPRLDAEVLLAHACGVSRTHLYTWPEQPLSDGMAARARALVEQRRQGVPVAYLTGQQEFWSLPLAVNAATLIPRPETELLVEQALQRIPPASTRTVLDLGTGSGAIALAVASERPQAAVTALDTSPDALQVAAGNSARLALEIELLESDWYSALADRRFDIIVANPPYIGTGEPEPDTGDSRYEPRLALIAADDGLAALRRIILEAPAHLQAGGWLLVEHGYRQGPACRSLFDQAGFVAIETLKDLQGHDRVTLGRNHHE
jgi:release factor glutamine methyltransferase